MVIEVDIRFLGNVWYDRDSRIPAVYVGNTSILFLYSEKPCKISLEDISCK